MSFLAMQSAGSSGLEQAMVLWGLVNSPTEMWLWLGLVLLIVEVFTVSFFAGAAALSAVVAAGASALGLDSLWQLAVFSLFSIGTLIWIRPVFVRWLAPKEVATNADALVGKTGTVVAQVSAGNPGRVKLVNEEWRATAAEIISVGEEVKVDEVQGNTLSVSRV
jgi:membrane protein implicated in regulation of membrane protease activity